MRHNVLHLIDTGGPGGAETIYLNVVDGLDRARWRSVAAVPWREWLSAELEQRGVEPHLLPTRGSFDWGYLVRLRALVRRERIDLIHTHLLTSSVYASAIARLARIPVVSTFHGQVDLAEAGRFAHVKFRIVQRQQNRVVFVSESLRRALQKAAPLGGPDARVIYNGISVDHFHPGRDVSLRAELGIGPDEIVIGAVGNIRPAKDYAVLLRAAALLSERGHRAHFVIVGDAQGMLYDELLALRRALGLEQVVHFTGFRSDVERVIQNFDLFTLTSSSEGFSLSTVQALACELPVIATRCGGPEEIITDGESGRLIPPGSPSALADAFAELIRDPALRKELARAGRASVLKRFSVESMVRQYAALYEECLGTTPPVTNSMFRATRSGGAKISGVDRWPAF